MKLFALVLALLVYLAAAQKQLNGCWDEDIEKIQVRNCTPNPPRGLCDACPYKIAGTNPDGSVKNCKSVFDLSSRKCGRKLRKYAKRTPCDKPAVEFVDLLYGRNRVNDSKAKQYLDRLVYAMCEFCCDAIPCGVAGKTWRQVRDDPRTDFVVATRSNGGLHIKSDNCGMHPDITVNGIKVCEVAGNWKKGLKRRRGGSPRINAIFYPAINQLLEDYGCSGRRIWESCYFRENAQGRLVKGHPRC